MRNYRPSLLATDAAERERFLTALRAIGTVAGAVKATGISETTARRQRNRDAAFDMAWTAVTGDPAIAKLEAALIHRAINGVVRTKTWPNGTVEQTIDYNDELGLTLLRKRMRDVYGDEPVAAAAPPPPPTVTREAFIAAIRSRLQAVTDLDAVGGEEAAGHSTA